jgi:hypothetical protein
MRTSAGIFIVIATTAILGFDGYLYLSDQMTITQQMISWSDSLMIVPFLWGFLMGHFFG